MGYRFVKRLVVHGLLGLSALAIVVGAVDAQAAPIDITTSPVPKTYGLSTPKLDVKGKDSPFGQCGKRWSYFYTTSKPIAEMVVTEKRPYVLGWRRTANDTGWSHSWLMAGTSASTTKSHL